MFCLSLISLISSSSRHTTLIIKMTPMKWWNNFLFIENLFGIYRNYCIQTKIKKCFIILQIFVQTMLQSIFLISQLNLLLGGDDCGQVNYIYSGLAVSSYVVSVSSVMTGICYSRAFMSYLKNISRVFVCFKNDKKLINSQKKLYWFCISLIIFSIGFAVFTSTEILIKYSYLDILILVFALILQTIIRMLIIFEYLLLFAVIMIVVHFSKCLNSLISTVQLRVGSCDISLDEQYDITREQIQGWVELYRDLANSCEKISICFGRQFFFTLLFSVSNYILISYQICYTIVSNVGDSDEFKKMGCIIFSYVSVLIMPIVAGQLTRNEGVKFHRAVTRLYNTMITNSGEAEAKLIKDFIRLIKKNPLEIKLLSKIPTGMYMLPVIITLAVNYVIVMLQINHVI